MEYGTTPVVAESNEEIYVNLLHGVAIGVISDILLDVCEYVALDAIVFCETSLMSFWVAMVFIGCWRISFWAMSSAGSCIE